VWTAIKEGRGGDFETLSNDLFGGGGRLIWIYIYVFIQIRVMSSGSMDSFWSSFQSVERGLGTRNRWTYFTRPNPMDVREEQLALHILAGITTYRIDGGTLQQTLPPAPNPLLTPLAFFALARPLNSWYWPHQQATAQ
jgi:hypothetical protein